MLQATLFATKEENKEVCTDTLKNEKRITNTYSDSNYGFASSTNFSHVQRKKPRTLFTHTIIYFQKLFRRTNCSWKRCPRSFVP